MNSDLLNNNGMCIPEELDGCLDIHHCSAVCCKFNRWGTMVAVGTVDGRILICDTITRQVVKSWMGHIKPVTALSWSRDGRKLLTGAIDRSFAVWNVVDATSIVRFIYSSPIISAMFNPRDDKQVLTLYLSGKPVINNTENKQTREVEFYARYKGDVGVVTVAMFGHHGKTILTGTSKGLIIFYNANTLRILTFVKQETSRPVSNIVISHHGRIVTNSQDRTIRIYDQKALLKQTRGSVAEPTQKLIDTINKASWKTICLSHDGNFVCGASAACNALYIWEITGALVKILHGTESERLHDVQWHPTRHVVFSIANGSVSVWVPVRVIGWYAYAPDFVEIEESIKHIEKESEFDLEDEDACHSIAPSTQDEEDGVVEVTSLEDDAFHCSSDEDDMEHKRVIDPSGDSGPLYFLRSAPETEMPQKDLHEVDFGLNNGGFSNATFSMETLVNDAETNN